MNGGNIASQTFSLLIPMTCGFQMYFKGCVMDRLQTYHFRYYFLSDSEYIPNISPYLRIIPLGRGQQGMDVQLLCRPTGLSLLHVSDDIKYNRFSLWRVGWKNINILDVNNHRNGVKIRHDSRTGDIGSGAVSFWIFRLATINIHVWW